MVFLLLLERTTFCADIERQSNGELKFTRRLCLEIPFDLIAASVYVFAYFNPKRGRTRVWAGIYHLVTLAENVTMGVLVYFYIPTATLPFSQFSVVSLSLVVGLYPLGLVFMFCYYLLYHPKRTGNCFWIGIPRNCCRCCCKEDQSEDGEVIVSKYQNRNSRVIISEPTLVSHNGYVPKNLLPVGPNAAATMVMNQYQNETLALSQPQSTGNGRVHRDRSLIGPEGRRASRMVGKQGCASGCGSGGVTSPDSSHTNTAPRTASERSNPAFSDCLASELDTDFSGSNLPETNDTVIDTPLSGCTPEVSAMPDSRITHITRLISQDNDSQKAYTNDTGIDVDSDLQLSPGTVGGDMEDMNQVVGGALCPSGEEPDEGQGGHKLPLFVDVPIKQEKLYRNGLEQHYFPDELNASTSDTAQDTVALHSRDSVTPTLPTPTYSPTPPSPTPNPIFPGGKWHSDDESEDVFRHGDSSSSPTMRQRGSIVAPQYPSPERQRKAPRSPIGARSHQISTPVDEEFSCSQQSSNSQTGPRAVTPRSPKGARRLLIQQSPPPTSPAQKKPRRQAPRPPMPPKRSSLQGGDAPAVNVTASVDPISIQQNTQPQIARPIPMKTPITPAQQTPPRSDGLTRGLMSLVPDRRAQSSSPFPVPRQHQVVPGNAPKYSRALSYHATGSTASPVRLSRGVANYRQSDNGLDSKVKGGSLHNMQYYHAQPRPKSEGWHMDKSIVLSPTARGMARQAPLNSHGSSPERSSHSSTSSGQSRGATSQQQQSRGATTQQQRTNAQRRSYNPQYPGTPKATPPHHAHAPKSAFVRVSPERNHAQHVGGWRSQRSSIVEGYSSPRPASMGGPPSSKSPRHYPKIPQGAPSNAPKMIRSPASNRNLPPPIPPPRREYRGSSSIDEALTDLNSSSHAHSLGGTSSKDSGNYDKLPSEMQYRNSLLGPGTLLSPNTLRPPQSSAHESTV